MTAETPKNGLFTDFYANAQMKSKGNYKDGKKEGKWDTWFKNGNKQCQGEYADGLEVGSWIWWNENGQKIIEGNYEDGIVVMNKFKDDEDAVKKAEELKALKLKETPAFVLDAEIDNIILTTENNPQDLFVEERIEIITAECVYGMNIFRDLFARARDIVGGRSVASQKILRDARKICLSELKKEAHSVGADAVIGVDLDYSEFSGGGKSMLFIVASGTAVKLKKG
jgi:uncharacterized protein YbjQ (UPF0145 family)